MTTLAAFINELKEESPLSRLPATEDWDGMILRTHTSGIVCEIKEETYWYFLEVLPPHFMGNGSHFGFAEGAEPLRLFWTTRDGYRCRQLTDDETRQFCHLANIPLPG